MVSRDEQHKPQLDSLRALAVFGVLVEHYIPSSDPLRHYIPFGDLGVQLFFVLSGYLITGILFRARRYSETREQTLSAGIRD